MTKENEEHIFECETVKEDEEYTLLRRAYLYKFCILVKRQQNMSDTKEPEKTENKSSFIPLSNKITLSGEYKIAKEFNQINSIQE